MSQIGIIDYECGNITSLRSAILKSGGSCIVSSVISELDECDKLILPGVGAFPHAMEMLKRHSLDEFLIHRAASGSPILGICLGMQLLFERSEEYGPCDGLGILKGDVKKLPADWPTIPNVGWWNLKLDKITNDLDLSNEDTFYFVHSYFCSPTDVELSINIEFRDEEICGMVKQDAIIGVQFHPEKSQKSGKKILDYFIQK